MGKVFAVGVGPGASDHLTEDVKKNYFGLRCYHRIQIHTEYNF